MKRGIILPQAIFIDRDGTIGGTDKVIYPGEFQLFPFVEDAMGKLKKSGYLTISFTNQPGISTGDAKKEEYEQELLGFGFDKVYLCPHQHNQGCQCRKPSTGMLLQAAKENNLNLKECVVIGDRWTDMLAAHDAGCIKILVKTGAGEKAFNNYQNHEYFGKWAEVSPDYIANDFQEAVNWIITNINR
ncbi:HAD-IIIA family hydrolase [Radiobacillus kanasensis]|uniref:HAD-IIIA family hydrolase n=1 Tax=Radiobacillus kanasensis TaxID=2844358 RepID=UPI001E50960A|nr:HAD-IIIA family hydrolase [Radiobacillus kanasensis]UFU00147.1 HAD-IIIA family hydrolase [Radiobacillus kanasensis]